MQKIFRYLMLISCVFGSWSICFSGYDPQSAKNYALEWWQVDRFDDNLDKFQDEYTDYVNSAGSFVTSTGPFTWYYGENNSSDDKDSRTNDGDNSVLSFWGFDCTNFISQALIAGGVKMSGPHVRGKGGTITSVDELGAVLPQIASVRKFTTLNGTPANLTIGDLLKLDNHHFMVVVGGSGRDVRLACHSMERDDLTLQEIFNRHKKCVLTAYHIIGDTLLTSADTTPPTVIVRDPSGRILSASAVTNYRSLVVDVQDAQANDDGVGEFEVTVNNKIINRIAEWWNGNADFIYTDEEHGYGFQYTYKLDNLPEGKQIFIQAFDKAGNVAIVPITIANAPPTIVSFFPQGSAVPIQSNILIEVSEELDPNTISGSVAVLDGGTALPGSVQFVKECDLYHDLNYDGSTTDYFLLFQPSANFPPGRSLTVVVRDKITDLAGNRLAGGNFSWSFATEIPAPSIAHQFINQGYAQYDLVIQSTITPFLSSLSRVELYYRNQRDQITRYTKVVMNKGSGLSVAGMVRSQSEDGGIYSAVIPGSQVDLNKPLEYFIYAVDSNGKTSSLPRINADPFIFSSNSHPILVFGDDNNGRIVKDQSGQHKALRVSFNLLEDLPFGNSIDVDIFKTNHDFSSLLNFPDMSLKSIVPLGSAKGLYSFVIDGTGLMDGNYFYVIKEVNFSGNEVKKLVNDGRFLAVTPLANVDVAVTPGRTTDLVKVLVSRTSQKLAASTVFEGQSIFKTSSQNGPGPIYNLTVAHADQGQGAGVYSTLNNKDVLIGLSGIPSINSQNAPEVILERIGTQTNNHPISLTASITDLTLTGVPGEVRDPRLYYKSNSGPYNWIGMDKLSNDMYVASIPVQPGGNTVFYFAEATDNEGHIGSDPFIDAYLNAYSFQVIVDNTPPTVNNGGLIPSIGESDVPVNTIISVAFSEDIRSMSYSPSVIGMKDSGGNNIELDPNSFLINSNSLTVRPKISLQPQSTYYVTVGDVIQDLSGNTLDGDGNGSPGGTFTWSFQTEALLPAALYSLSQTPGNITVSQPQAEFSATVSTPVKNVTLVLSSLSTNEEFRISDTSGTPVAAQYPYRYKFIWDGKQNGTSIPEGAYRWHLEAIDRQNQLFTTSEIQPFRWIAAGEATVTYGKNAQTIRYGFYNYLITNEDQTVSANYNYSGEIWDPANPSWLENCRGQHFNLGTYHDRSHGSSGRWGVPVQANCKMLMIMDDRTESLNVDYFRRYYHASSRDYFQKLPLKSHIELLSNGAFADSTFQIKFDPISQDPFEPEWDPVHPDKSKIRTRGVSVSDMKVLGVQGSDDYDDNPKIQSTINILEVGQNSLTVHFHARNLDQLPVNFIYDVTPPTLGLSFNRFAFSPQLDQDVTMTMYLSDNLPYGLKNTSLKLLDSDKNLVQTLYEKFVDVDGDREITWNGTDSQGQLVQDGTYTVVAQAEDAVGNPNQIQGTLLLDTTPPDITNPWVQITPGLSSATFTSKDASIDVNFTLSDNLSPNVLVTLSASNGNQTFNGLIVSTFDVTPAGNNAVLLWDGKDLQGNPVPDGTYTLTLTATDVAGNTSSFQVPSFQIDQTPPLIDYLYSNISLFSPDDGPNGQGDGVNDTLTITYKFSSQASVHFTIENTLFQVLLDNTVSQGEGEEKHFTWDGKINGTFVPDGATIFRLTAQDSVGNESSEKVTVIKNQIPARITFPSLLTNSTRAGGKIDVQGFAMDPLINDTTGFAGYKLWYRAGADIDFNLPENNPFNPDLSVWNPVPVPISYQSSDLGANPTYPDSNHSRRSVSNTTLGYWDTTSLLSGTTYTLLLIDRDFSNNVSFDSTQIDIDQNVDDTAPTLNITTPLALQNITLANSSDQVHIDYDLSAPQNHKTHVSIEVFSVPSMGTFGPVVCERNILNQSAGQEVLWDGRDLKGQLIQSGNYRIRITARDADHIGIDVKEVDINLDVSFGEPVKIQGFQSSSDVVAPNDTVTLSFLLSREADVLIKGFDIDHNVQATFSTRAVSGFFDYSNGMTGLYRWELTATSIDTPQTQDSASLFVVVGTSGGGPGGDITSTNPPASNGTVCGLANFNWATSASGYYFPIQSFTPTIKADGKELLPTQNISETLFNGGTKTNVVASNGDLSSAFEAMNQQQLASNNSIPPFASGWHFAQSFFFGKSGYIRRIQFYLRPPILIGYSNNMGIQVRQDNNGQPGNVIFEYDLGSMNNFPEGWYGVDMNFPIASNTQYWAVWKWIKTKLPAPYRHEDYGNMFGTDYDSYGSGVLMIGSDAYGWNLGTDIPIFFNNLRDLKFKIDFEGYFDSGQYVSPPLDTQKTSGGQIFFDPMTANSTLNGQTVNFKLQTSDDGVNWDPEYSVNLGQPITMTGKRYLRNIVDLIATDTRNTPIVHDFNYAYRIIEPFSYSKTLSDPSYTTITNHPTYVPNSPSDLSTFFPELTGKNISQGPTYSVTSSGNPSVTVEVTNENAVPQLKATTQVKDPWDSTMDQNLSSGTLGEAFYEFNNSSNPYNFTTEAPFSFDPNSHGLKPITISTAYPPSNMMVDASIKNKFLFWKDAQGETTDNPYVAVNAGSGGWNLNVIYPDGTPDDTLSIFQDSSKPSNTNTDPATGGTPWDLDDDFTVKLTTGKVPKVFVELRGQIPSQSDGFQSYALYYKSKSESAFHSIFVSSPTRSVPSGQPLGYWDVTGLQGDYDVKLVVVSNGVLQETVKSYTLGTLVPSKDHATGTTYVAAPYNKAFLEFPQGSLAQDSLVTITPRKLSDTGLQFDPGAPQPLGPVFEMLPKNIQFAKDGLGKVLVPGSLTVRFLPGELEGVDPGLVTIYGVSEDGIVQPFDARVTMAGDITTIVCPFSGFSYHMVLSSMTAPVIDSIPAAVSQPTLQVKGNAIPLSTVDILGNGSVLGEAKAQPDGSFQIGVNLVEGKNILTAQTHSFFNLDHRRIDRSSPFSPAQTTVLDNTPPSVSFISISLPTFCPYEHQTTTLSFVASEPLVSTVSVQLSGCVSGCSNYFVNSSTISPGPSFINWDGKDLVGHVVVPGTYTFLVNLQDLIGNTSSITRDVVVLPPEPPTAQVRSPLAGQFYSPNGQNLVVDFSVFDNVDSNPAFSASLVHSFDGFSVAVSSNEVLNTLKLPTGTWNLTINMSDESGYSTQTVTGPFDITPDVRAPRTSLVVGNHKQGPDGIEWVDYLSSFSFVADDDLVVQGDGQGVGVGQTFYTVEQQKSQPFLRFEDPFYLNLGTYTIRYYSVDKARNREETSTATIEVKDLTPPPGVHDLAALTLSTDSVSYSWSWPYKNDREKDATLYYSLFVSTDPNVLLATESLKIQGTSEWNPGVLASVTVIGLRPSTSYYATVILEDEAGNKSGSSNIITAFTRSLLLVVMSTPPFINDYAAVATSNDTISVVWTIGANRRELANQSFFVAVGTSAEAGLSPLDLKYAEQVTQLDFNYFSAKIDNLQSNTRYYSRVIYSDNSQTIISNLISTITAITPFVGQNPSSPSSPPLSFGEVYVYPNPALKGKPPIFHVETGLVDQVQVKIFDILGNLVKELESKSVSIIGSGQTSKYAYVIPWEGHIPSGVYLYVVTSEKSGSQSIKRRGRFSVVR